MNEGSALLFDLGSDTVKLQWGGTATATECKITPSNVDGRRVLVDGNPASPDSDDLDSLLLSACTSKDVMGVSLDDDASRPKGVFFSQMAGHAPPRPYRHLMGQP